MDPEVIGKLAAGASIFFGLLWGWFAVCGRVMRTRRYDIITAIREYPGVTRMQLVQEHGIHHGSMYGILAYLREDGLVVVTNDHLRPEPLVDRYWIVGDVPDDLKPFILSL